MLHEIRTYTLVPGGVHAVETRAAAALHEGVVAPGLAAYWHTEVGPLNQIVTVWLDEGAGADAARPLEYPEHMVSRSSELWRPTPFMRPLVALEHGGFFEMRTYTFRPGTIASVLEVWTKGVPERERLSPLIACWYAEGAEGDRFRHVWAYRSFEERLELRKRALELPHWPPPTRESRVSEENRILLAAPFSPIR